MTFKEFKSIVELIHDCEELTGWEFDRLLTTFQNVILKQPDDTAE
jgi:hypothetical protein